MKARSLFTLSVLLALSFTAMGQRKIARKKPLFNNLQCTGGDCETGIGSATNSNGDMYYGHWLKGRPHGLGTVYFDLDNKAYSPGTFFTGRFYFGLVDGIGTFDFPGEKRMTVKFDKSQDFAVFEDVGRMHPRKRRMVMDNAKKWEGWEVRQQAYFKNGSPDRILVSMHKDRDGALCWSTEARSGAVKIFFLIDTGCSGTALNKSTIDYLIRNGIRVTKTGTGFYSTACGLMEFDQYEIESLTLGGVTFKNLSVSETLSDNNLLGMNVLGSFGTFEFNEEQQTLSLK